MFTVLLVIYLLAAVAIIGLGLRFSQQYFLLSVLCLAICQLTKLNHNGLTLHKVK
ncbi:Uncharacterised protein [Vibrio cholerae]|nr:Uncharacterised protein [Vibrio cholerae]